MTVSTGPGSAARNASERAQDNNLDTQDDVTLLARAQPGPDDTLMLIEPGFGTIGVWTWDACTDAFDAHGFWSGFLGYDAWQPVRFSVDLYDVTHPDDLPGALAAWKACVKGQVTEYEAEHRLRHRDGSFRWVLARGRVTERDKRGRTVSMHGIYFDIERFKAVQISLAQANSVLRTVLDAIPQMVYWKDRESRYLGCNPIFAKNQGLASSIEVLGMTDEDMYWGAFAERMRAEDRQLLSGALERLVVEEHFVDANGNDEWWEKIKVPLRDADGAIIGVLGADHNLTGRKQAEREIERLAFFDPLTELPNRRYFMERLEEAIGAARRHGGAGALLYLDLDHFKNINDMLGHAAGDRLLTEAGVRIRRLLRQEDVAARIGGDEFVVLMGGLAATPPECARQAGGVAEKIRTELARPFAIDGQDLYVSATIGIAIFPNPNDSVESLMRMADSAMYGGKAEGRNVIFFFNPELLRAAEERLEIETSLRTAIAREELAVYYQPQVDAYGVVHGAEALLRWNHPVLGFVSPARFIPIAEECGLIAEIGLWVLERAVRTLHGWIEAGVASVDLLSVNISIRQFRATDFVAEVENMLNAYPHARGRLQLELTESAAVEQFDETIAKMDQLRAMGVLFSIDDFGVGYSSLSYLARLPIDQIKIDRSFITDIENGQHKAAIVATLMMLGTHLDYMVVAEGVENALQLEVLVTHGCQRYQGFLFSPALPESEFLAYCAGAAEIPPVITG